MAKDQESKELDEAKRIMEALVRKPPKPHDDMKVGKGPMRPSKRRKPKEKPG